MLTLANQLTIFRLTLVPFFVLMVLSNRHGWAFALFLTAGLTDLLDGSIARRWGQQTRLGAFLDPLADKLLVGSAVVLLSLPDHIRLFPTFELANHFWIELTILVASRDLLIVLVALLLHLAYDVRRFEPTIFGKAHTVILITSVAVALLYNTLRVRSTVVLPVLMTLSLSSTLVSGFHYIYRAASMAGESQKQAEDR